MDEYCDDCKANGDDYYVNEDGETVWACEECPVWMAWIMERNDGC